jgi:cytochrome c-type biogenesis protein CcmH
MKLLAGLLLLVAAAGAAAQQPKEAADTGPGAVVGPPRGTPVEAAALEARTREVSALLRCPVCQGLSVADSPATMAMKMKAEVREMVAAGYDQDQILAYFERSYGEFVRLKPPLRGVNWLVWLAPALGLVLGLVVVAWALRAPGETADDATPSSASAVEADAPPDDPALVPYLLRVREMAYGWPAGVRPGSEPS